MSSSFLFLWETHVTVNDKIKWKDDFKDKVFYSRGKYNSCSVLICFIGSKKLFIRNKLSENDDGRILILDVDIDSEIFILINLLTLTPKLDSWKSSFEIDGDANQVTYYSK